MSVKKSMQSMGNLRIEDVLESLGMKRRRNLGMFIWPAGIALGLGLAGLGLGMLVFSAKGRERRASIGNGVKKLFKRAEKSVVSGMIFPDSSAGREGQKSGKESRPVLAST